MINDHNNQHSNTYPFHGNRSDHLEEKKFFKICLDRRQSTDTIETLPKAQRTRGLSSSFQSNLLGHITSSNTNLDQTSSSKSGQSIFFKISTKHHHLD